MTAALKPHSIGVLSISLFSPKAFERSVCILHALFVPQSTPSATHPCLHSIPDVAVLLARTFFYHFSKGLAGYPFVFGKRSRSTKYCLASFNFFCHSSRTGFFLGPEELKQRSHMFSGQSKNHHETTYTSGLRAFTHHHQHGFFPCHKMLLPLLVHILQRTN
jgi:hypothetical protein